MKQYTITVSDEAAKRLEEHAAENGKSAAELASLRLQSEYSGDWFDELDDDAKAAIAEAEAEAKRGEFASDEEVENAFAAFRE